MPPTRTRRSRAVLRVAAATAPGGRDTITTHSSGTIRQSNLYSAPPQHASVLAPSAVSARHTRSTLTLAPRMVLITRLTTYLLASAASATRMRSSSRATTSTALLVPALLPSINLVLLLPSLMLSMTFVDPTRRETGKRSLKAITARNSMWSSPYRPSHQKRPTLQLHTASHAQR